MSFSMRGQANANALTNLVANFRRGVMGGGAAAVRIITDRARQGMQEGPHSGFHYRSLPNRSSAPGEYAANQSGRAMGSIGGTNSLWQMRVWMRAPHAGYIEEGTSRMGARPTLGNAVRDTDEQVRATLGEFVWIAIR